MRLFPTQFFQGRAHDSQPPSAEGSNTWQRSRGRTDPRRGDDHGPAPRNAQQIPSAGDRATYAPRPGAFDFAFLSREEQQQLPVQAAVQSTVDLSDAFAHRVKEVWSRPRHEDHAAFFGNESSSIEPRDIESEAEVTYRFMFALDLLRADIEGRGRKEHYDMFVNCLLPTITADEASNIADVAHRLRDCFGYISGRVQLDGRVYVGLRQDGYIIRYPDKFVGPWCFPKWAALIDDLSTSPLSSPQSNAALLGYYDQVQRSLRDVTRAVQNAAERSPEESYWATSIHALRSRQEALADVATATQDVQDRVRALRASLFTGQTIDNRRRSFQPFAQLQELKRRMMPATVASLFFPSVRERRYETYLLAPAGRWHETIDFVTASSRFHRENSRTLYPPSFAGDSYITHGQTPTLPHASAQSVIRNANGTWSYPYSSSEFTGPIPEYDIRPGGGPAGGGA